MGDLLGHAEPSSPVAAQRRAVGAGLDGESAHRAIILFAALRAVVGVCLERASCCLGTSVYRHCVGRRIGLRAPGAALAVGEPIALAIHFENMDMMGQAIEQGDGQPLGAEAFMMPPFFERLVCLTRARSRPICFSESSICQG
jgi:hypothetical protein